MVMSRYKRVDDRENLKVIVVTDASFFQIKKYIKWTVIMLASTKTYKVCFLECRSTIKNVCNSITNVETWAAFEGIMNGTYTVERIEQILFGKVEGEILAELSTDSEPFMISITLRKRVANLKFINLVDTKRNITWRQIKWGFIS